MHNATHRSWNIDCVVILHSSCWREQDRQTDHSCKVCWTVVHLAMPWAAWDRHCFSAGRLSSACRLLYCHTAASVPAQEMHPHPRHQPRDGRENSRSACSLFRLLSLVSCNSCSLAATSRRHASTAVRKSYSAPTHSKPHHLHQHKLHQLTAQSATSVQ